MNTEKKNIDQILEESFSFDGSVVEIIETKNKIKETLLENTFIRLMEEADDEKSANFEVFISEEKTPAELTTYLQENFPQFYEILFEEVELLKST